MRVDRRQFHNSKFLGMDLFLRFRTTLKEVVKFKKYYSQRRLENNKLILQELNTDLNVAFFYRVWPFLDGFQANEKINFFIRIFVRTLERPFFVLEIVADLLDIQWIGCKASLKRCKLIFIGSCLLPSKS